MKPEIIIIGGGVIGTACAYFLSKRGLKVLVLERSHLGAGASGTTASIVSIGGGSSTPKPLQPINVESYHLILDAEQDFERSLEIIRGGTLYAAMNEQEALELQAFDKEFLNVVRFIEMNIPTDTQGLIRKTELEKYHLLTYSAGSTVYILHNPAGKRLHFHTGPPGTFRGKFSANQRRICLPHR